MECRLYAALSVAGRRIAWPAGEWALAALSWRGAGSRWTPAELIKLTRPPAFFSVRQRNVAGGVSTARSAATGGRRRVAMGAATALLGRLAAAFAGLAGPRPDLFAR